jgi:hypothetical protein
VSWNLGTQEALSRPESPISGGANRTRGAARRWLAVAASIAGSLALFGLFLRVSLSMGIDSDGANNTLQGWDLLHGNLLLHGWVIGDANYLFLELPLNAIGSAVFGFGAFAAHAASALTYLLVTLCAAALAMTGSQGAARAARCAVAVMVLAAPLLAVSIRLLLEEPDHIGTAVFVLGSFLLIERAYAKRFTAPLVCVILCLGEFNDLTVRYVAVPAIVLVCGYRAVAARKLRSPDAAFVAAAVVSVPLAVLLNAIIVHLGGFVSAAPKARLSPLRLWPHQAAITWSNIRLLFGAIHERHARFDALGFDFRVACLLAAVAGLVWACCRWWRVSRADQLLCVAIVCNVGIDLGSVLATPGGAHELAVVLPCGAVLAARLVPARITSLPVAFAAVVVTALAAVLPLVSAAAASPAQERMAPLTAWLEAHGLKYGVASYWDASAASVQSGGKVDIVTINLNHAWPSHVRETMWGSYYEDKMSWYDPWQHDATFAVADAELRFPAAAFEQAFGKPAATHRVGPWVVLIYRSNLLEQLTSASSFAR